MGRGISPSDGPHQTIPSVDRFYNTPYKVKGYADDLAIMSQSPEEHQHLLDHMDICSGVGSGGGGRGDVLP